MLSQLSFDKVRCEKYCYKQTFPGGRHLMSIQNGQSPLSLQASIPRPTDDDRNTWQIYWQAQGQPWRIEPDIDVKRQTYLARQRAISPDFEQDIYPFKDIQLNREDVEWLLATHENGKGPVIWSDESQRSREGLDLRGACLNGVDLSGLPLACIIGGLNMISNPAINSSRRKKAAVILDGANLRQAHLEGAILYNASAKGASLQGAFLQKIKARWARLEEARLRNAHLEEADLHNAHLEGSTLKGAFLYKTDLSKAFFDTASTITDLGSRDATPLLADVRWGGVNLTLVDWSQILLLEDERIAKKEIRGTRQLAGFLQAVRAYRQLALELERQGLNEEAARFAYHAQVLQRRVLGLHFLQRKMNFGQRIQSFEAWLFSWFLFLLAGYGYKPGRSFLAYLLMIFGFATAYYTLGHTFGQELSPLSAFVFSMTSFHGRGFFPGDHFSLDNPLIVLAALEALVGLIIEVTFIATLTQRLFSR